MRFEIGLAERHIEKSKILCALEKRRSTEISTQDGHLKRQLNLPSLLRVARVETHARRPPFTKQRTTTTRLIADSKDLIAVLSHQFVIEKA